MQKKSFSECELEQIKKLKKYQLPHSFKKIGAILFVLSFVSMFIVAFTANDPVLKEITKYGILFGLLLNSISKEKVEDELIINIRQQSYAYAFIAGVILALIMPLADYLVDFLLKGEDPVLQGLDSFPTLFILLFVQVFYFEMMKRLIHAK